MRKTTSARPQMNFSRANLVRAAVLGALILAVMIALLTRSFMPQHSSPHTAVAHSVSGSAENPLVSRGKPVFCSTSDALVGPPNAITSGKYGQWSFWSSMNNALPTWCAIKIGAGPQRLMVVWYSDYDAFDYIVNSGRMPQDYTLLVSSNSTNGQDGDWRVATTVTGNHARVREHVISFTGDAWVKMMITKAPDHPSQTSMVIDQIDCFDVSANTNDTVLFQGDSLTADAYNQFSENDPSFSKLVHQYDPALYPSMLNEGFGGWASSGAVDNIDQWLALNPDIHYWLLGWGTNDAFEQVSPVQFRANLQTLVTKIRSAGHVPVIARIPALQTTSSAVAADNARIQAFNAQIDALTHEDHLIPGPDLYTLMSHHPNDYFGADHIHPNAAGSAAMNYAWYLAMRTTLSKA